MTRSATRKSPGAGSGLFRSRKIIGIPGFRWPTGVAMTVLLLMPLTPRAPGQDYSASSNPLQTLPPIQAIPINTSSGSSGDSPQPLACPPYCDSETLRESATIRSLRFNSNGRGIGVGDHGVILVTDDGGQTWNIVNSGVQCRLNDVLWIGSDRVVVVGGGFDVVTRISRGVVLVSHDAGRTWHQSGDAELPLLYSIQPTPDAGDARGGPTRRSITATGQPDPITGASLFLSRDGGGSWQSELHGQSDLLGNQLAPAAAHRRISAEQSEAWAQQIKTHGVIRTSCRMDGQTVFCAGDHGNIFRSGDNGQTWLSVRGENASCAVLVVASGIDQIPWTLLGRESLEKRLRTSIIIANSPDEVPATIDQAAMQLGVTAVDTFSNSVPAEAIESLQRWIDVHHPPIVAIDADLDSQLKASLLQHAVAGGTEKVIEYSRASRGETLLHDSAMLPGCGALAGDFADDSQLLVSNWAYPISGSASHPWIAINTRYSGGAHAARGDSLGFGVRLTSAHRLPARDAKASRRRLQVVQGRLKQETAIADLFESEERSGRNLEPDRFANALRRLLDQTSRADQFRSAWSIARASIGMSKQTTIWNEISRRFTDSSAAQLAGLHSRARQASVEWQHHQTSMTLLDRSATKLRTDPSAAALPDAAQELLPNSGGHSAIVSPFQTLSSKSTDSPSAVVQASASLPLGGSNGFKLISPTPINPDQRAAQREIDLAWQMHPIRLIVEDAIARNSRHVGIDNKGESDQIPTDTPAADQGSLADEPFSADVRRIAERQSQWSNLLKPISEQTAIAKRTTVPPRLDGVLDDACWSTTRTKPAQTRDFNRTTLQLAWDDQFIYVAVQVPTSHFKARVSAGDVGSRDADLTHLDRVVIGFDIDRDLLTAMNLGFTREGQTHDDLDGFDGWNPTWYVATDEVGGTMTTEIAIEQRGLGASVQPGDSWFVESRSIRAGHPRRYTMMPDPLSRIRVDFQ